MNIPVYYTYEKKDKPTTMLVGLNQVYSMHYMHRAKMVRYFHELLSHKIKASKIKGQVKTQYTYFYKNSQSDAPNVVSAIDKMFMDALQSCGVIDDDNVLNYIGSSWKVGGQDKENPRLEVKLIEVV